jgi:glycosyltransferase involved in cell wall biosynthesis
LVFTTRIPKEPKHDAEIVVVDNSTDGTAEIIRDEFPRVKLIPAPAAALMPELWETGIRQSTGGIVALTTTHFVPRHEWLEQITQAHRADFAGIGGAIENDPRGTLTDWAVYFCRYSAFIPPFAAGTVRDIAADNASYKRLAIDQCREVRRNGFWEAMVHDRFRKTGQKLRLDPGIVVHHKRSFTLTGFVAQRFRHGRQFGSARALRSPGLKRLIYLTLSPSIPLLLFFRIARRAIANQRYVGKFLISLPILLLFLASWSLGEASGYLRIASNGETT